jgi:hypothetical protein
MVLRKGKDGLLRFFSNDFAFVGDLGKEED